MGKEYVNNFIEGFEKEFFTEDEKRTEIVSVRTTPTIKKWMKDNKIVPTKVFNFAAHMLMERDKVWKKKK